MTKNTLLYPKNNYYLFLLVFCFIEWNAEAQLLENYIAEALENSPKIEALTLKHQVVSEQKSETSALPNTEFSAGYFISEPETRTGAQDFKLSVKQMMPWFGTRAAKKNYAISVADATYTEIKIAERKLSLSVAQSYYKLYALKAQQKILDQNIDLLKTYEELALTAVETNKASAVDILRLQIRQNELSEKKEILIGNEFAEESNFNNLLNRRNTETISVEDSISIPKEEPVLAIEDNQIHPELIKYDKLVESVKKSERINQKEALPNLGFGIDYIAVNERPEINFSDNGKDIVMPMVSVGIPIFNTKYKSVSRQNEIRQKALAAEKNTKKNELDSQLKTAINQRISARISFHTQQKNRKQAKDAEEILLKKYESGTLDFKELIEIQELQLQFQLAQIKAVKNYYLQTTIINYLNK